MRLPFCLNPLECISSASFSFLALKVLTSWRSTAINCPYGSTNNYAHTSIWIAIIWSVCDFWSATLFRWPINWVLIKFNDLFLCPTFTILMFISLNNTGRPINGRTVFNCHSKFTNKTCPLSIEKKIWLIFEVFSFYFLKRFALIKFRKKRKKTLKSIDSLYFRFCVPVLDKLFDIKS